MSKCLSSRLQKMTMISSATTMAQERQTPPPLSPKFPIHFCSWGAACITSFCSCRRSSRASSNLPLLEASCSTPPGVCRWITVKIIHTSGGFHGPGHKDKLAHAYTGHAFLGGPWCELGLWIPDEIHGYIPSSKNILLLFIHPNQLITNIRKSLPKMFCITTAANSPQPGHKFLVPTSSDLLHRICLAALVPLLEGQFLGISCVAMWAGLHVGTRWYKGCWYKAWSDFNICLWNVLLSRAGKSEWALGITRRLWRSVNWYSSLLPRHHWPRILAPLPWRSHARPPPFHVRTESQV